MGEPRRIVLADPLAGNVRRPRFAAAGQGAAGGSGDVKMFEWDSEAEIMNMVGLHSEISAGIKALAWSPNPMQRHLLALGLSTGRTQILTLSPSSLAVPLRGDQATNSALLTVKHSRPVSSLAFSSADPLLLASGYDRHRSDYSLLIWDISDAIAAFPQDPDGDATWQRPPERLEPSNLYGRAGDGVRHLQQYCASEAVHSLAWVPESAHELLAGANNKALRMYDLRTPTRDSGGISGGATVHWATRAVHFITPDPQKKQRLASVETGQGGSIVRLWDVRRPGVELASFEVADSSGVVALEWTGGTGQTGLGVGTCAGGANLWEVVSGGERVDGADNWTYCGGVRHVVKPKQQMLSFTFAPPTKSRRDVVFVVKDGTIGVGPLPAAPVLAFGSHADLVVATTEVSSVDPEVSGLTRVPSPAAPASPTRASDRRSLHMDERRINRFQLAPERVSALLSEQWEQRSRKDLPGLVRRHGSRRSLAAMVDEDEMDEYEFGEEITGPDGLRRVLRHDAAFIMRRRAEEGYGVDSLELNAAVATRFPGAERIAGIWEFVDHFVRATGPEASQEGRYDLTYQGVWSIWTGLFGADARVEAATGWGGLRGGGGAAGGPGSGASTPRRGAPAEFDAEYNAAITRLNATRTLQSHIAAPGAHRLPHTDRMPQRRMMLAVCGENMAYDTMAEVHRLVDDEQRTKAACWAFFAGEEGPAITILMRSDDERHRLMGATIAGFMSQSRAERGSVFFQEHWRGMIDKVDDPYIRAVLARIAGENWDGILYDESLPLLDRVAVAVCNLEDRDLTQFLRNRLRRCTTLGSLPGLVLTGFTSAGVALLQRFVDRTGDVQTAALLASFFPRLHLSAGEVLALDRWQDAYRNYLDSWLAWITRCSFDVAAISERRTLHDDPINAIQTVVVCRVCQRQLTRQTQEMLERKNALKGKMDPPPITVRTNICMYCQNALPRCSICLLHVRPPRDESADTMEDAYVACQTCRHGGHAKHILGWFEGGLDGGPSHDICPVAGCSCQCAAL
ncbi:uncharacterized protein CcaverHIS019_0209320 [Cutaneotrichosporon cavernicola]|uniref:WD repeat protein mio zinc-ribbon like domain-containing protein n=1 Tax=Cutaneotrichosporon cavernicola TaxID=279322 RepID=A0AA48L1F9_9TREE|nr:uncharacterized protein CcaverHIS019_0209320 [Cutaneotrichosporon cavernicola]BEI89570.1 hypothetical protein CcaverHIS019_0209320 [Cutaneotrichosporon cavernicola]BEJ05118.1 hypothetical protein CcaverHIS641_0209350 [Cutaneotrichosporon cavernicola]